LANELDGKVALITGGGAGIGEAIARAYAQAGCKVAVADTNAPGVESVAGEISGLAIVTDVTDEAQISAMFDACDAAFGKLDILVNNAGIVPSWSETEKIDAAMWDAVFAVNVRGVILCCKHGVPLLKRQGGVIVNMASVVGLRADPLQCAYCASKSAVVGITQSVAQEVGKLGIRVNALCPGPVGTEALLGRVRTRADADGRDFDEAVETDLRTTTAMHKLVEPAEVAKAALFLASDAASAITGETLKVDAGRV
jgi:hypothetical protein